MSLLGSWLYVLGLPGPSYRFVLTDWSRLGCGCPLDAFSAPVLCVECGHTRCLPHRDQVHDCKVKAGVS